MSHGTQRKGRVEQFYCCVYCCRDNVSTDLLPSNEKGIHMQIHRLMGENYEIRRKDGCKCHNIRVHSKFHKYWFRYIARYSQTHRQRDDHEDYTRLLLFLPRTEKSRLQMQGVMH
jgi:hypothetical protein